MGSGAGRGTCWIRNTSGPPKPSWTTARIVSADMCHLLRSIPWNGLRGRPADVDDATRRHILTFKVFYFPLGSVLVRE
ncbi:hypothetical protein JCM12681A_71250 [Streptomyces mexicanus]